MKHFKEPHFDSELMLQKIGRLRRLAEIQEYVLYTRGYNQAVLEFLEEKFSQSFKMRSEPYDDQLSELVFDHFSYMYVDFWFERGEVHYILTETKEKTEAKTFNPLDLHDAMDDLDKQFAKEIIEFKNLIWN